MNGFPKSPLSSLPSLTSSIATDFEVYRWFSWLVIQPMVQSQLKSQPENISLYQKLRKNIFWQRILYGCISIGLMAIIFSKQYFFAWGAIPCLVMVIALYLLKRKCIIELSSALLKKDFEAKGLSGKTLYQMSEIYSREYHTLSLVDAIYHWERLSRKAVMFAFILTSFIYPLQLGAAFSFILIFYGMAFLFFNTTFAYRLLR